MAVILPFQIPPEVEDLTFHLRVGEQATMDEVEPVGERREIRRAAEQAQVGSAESGRSWATNEDKGAFRAFIQSLREEDGRHEHGAERG